MNDLELAKEELKNKSLSFVIAGRGKILFESKEEGILSLLKALKEFGSRLKGSALADKVVGKAAAFLILHGGFLALYSSVISDDALNLLQNTGLKITFDRRVPQILNKAGTDRCPLEKLSMEFKNSEEFIYELSKRILKGS